LGTRAQSGFAKAVGLALVASLQLSSYAATIPEVRYQPVGDIRLLFNNNPEQITSEDLADQSLGGKSLYAETLTPGRYRNFFEHLNRTQQDMGYQVRLTNSGDETAEVVLHSVGFEAGLNGADAFSQAFNQSKARELRFSLAPNQHVDLFRLDRAAKNNQFFSGVTEFTVKNGRVRMDNLAYKDARDVSPRPDYIGYVQRVDADGTREARMYKGTASHAEVRADMVDFSFSDADPSGVLAVRHAAYDLEKQAYGESSVRRDGWVSNITPKSNPQGISSDMLGFQMPGWGPIDPFRPTDGTGSYPNLGNWGPVYTLQGKLSNQGGQDRVVRFRIKANPKSAATIAFLRDDGTWGSKLLARGESLVYREVRVPAGAAVNYSASWVLGGPSGGSLQQTAELTDVESSQGVKADCL
jgi:hypothetical protein